MTVWMFRETMRRFLHFIRYWDWQDKIQSITVASLVFFLFAGYGWSNLFDIVVLIFYLYTAFSYGYLLNDFVDRDTDIKANKKKNNYLLSIPTIRFLIVVLGLLTLLLPLLFGNFWLLVVAVLTFMLGTMYSLKPFYLKGRGFVGLFASSVSQRLPFLFLVFLFPEQTFFLLYLFGWLIVLGFIIEISYQLGDYFYDEATDIDTFAVASGISTTKYITYSLVGVLIVYVLLPLLYGVYTGLYHLSFLSLFLFIFSQGALADVYRNVIHIENECVSR